ncbi:hypothetical protein YC2023_117273 [Brassica napus]
MPDAYVPQAILKNKRLPFPLGFIGNIDRGYPRDFMEVGRVVVQLKREDETLLNPAINSSNITSRRYSSLVNRASGYVYTCLKVRSPSSFTQKILTWMGLSFCSLDWL